MPKCDTLLAVNAPLDTVPVPAYRLPASFRNCAQNVLTDTLDTLREFWEKLRLARAGVPGDSIRVLHIGDSHVRGHFFPTATGNLLRLAFGRVAYTDMGINGAYCLTFAREDRIAAIAAARPDLLILSFGTNESHNRSYDRMAHTHQMEELLRMLRRRLPQVPIILTTPPGSFESARQKNRRRSYTANARTARVSENICRFAAAHGLAVWNLYRIAGGNSAPLNWQAARLMRPDHIHFLAQGYQLQGELFYQALVKAYNDFITSPVEQAAGGGRK
ncbi:MAG: GDSL-type esterase/lipase family protein [Prevotellaceae bacterium]|nr:GDSL-type esterase/lipase family protein [Prevotellaceae bacterium]